MWLVIILFLIGVATFLYYYLTKDFGQFKKYGIPEHDGSFPFGSKETLEMFTGQRPITRGAEPIYLKYKQHKVVGYHSLGNMTLVVNDLDLVKQMFIKDFDHFVDRRKVNLGTGPLAKYFDNNLLNLDGDQWKEMRSTVSPAFTSGKLRVMCKLIDKVGTRFAEYVEQYATTGEQFNAREVFYLYTTESIATTGFGIDADCFGRGSQFKDMVKRFTGADASSKDMIKLLVLIMFPRLANLLGINLFDGESLGFFLGLINDVVKQRKDQATTAAKRNVMVDLLYEALTGQVNAEIKEQVKEEFDMSETKQKNLVNLSEEELKTLLMSNLLLLFLAGLDTSSATLAACAYFLSTEVEVQERVYNELLDVMDAEGNDELDYNAVQKLNYLDMCVHETLRCYPLADIERKCTKAYKVPGTNFVVPEGMMVQVSGSGIMGDEKYFPNPEKFNPDNFSPENKAKRHPYAFLGFGIGPRSCIGMRLALLQVKISLAKLVYNYKLVPGEKMPKKLEVDPTSINSGALGGVWVKLQKRDA